MFSVPPRRGFGRVAVLARFDEDAITRIPRGEERWDDLPEGRLAAGDRRIGRRHGQPRCRGAHVNLQGVRNEC